MSGWTPELRAAASERMKKRMSDPEYKMKMVSSLKKTLSNHQVKTEISASQKKRRGTFVAPDWVPIQFNDVYCDIAKMHGVETAVRRCKKLAGIK